MRDFNRGRSGGGRDFKRRDFDGPQVMHKTICSDCGKECEVPFKPNGSKPVFCRDCFQGKRVSEGPRENNFPPRHSNFEDRGPQINRPAPVLIPQYGQQFEALNAKLDRILSMLNVAKSQERPVVKETVKEKVTAKPVPIAEVKDVEVPVVKKKRVTKKSPAA